MPTRSTKVVLILLALASAQAATAETYTFTRVAGGIGSPFENANVELPLINNAGQVLFVADDGLNRTYYRTTTQGATPVPIAVFRTGFSYPFADEVVFLNDNGEAAFHVFDEDENFEPVISIVKGNGGPLTTIYISTGSVIPTGLFGFNDAGAVAFSGFTPFPDLQFALFRGNGGALTTIVNDPDGEGTIGFNNSNQAVYVTPDNDMLFRSDGVTTTPIADDSGNLGLIATAGVTQMNQSGMVFFSAFLDDFTIGLFRGDGNAVTPVFVSNNDADVSQFSLISIADSGQVAFVITDENIGAAIQTGPNLVTDRVIGVGDMLMGASVSDVVISHRAINSAGQIVFQATIEDGFSTQAIYVATPQAQCDGPPDGDMNDDSASNGVDLQSFVAAVVGQSTAPLHLCHGDFNDNALMDAGDVAGMIAALLD